MNKTWSHPLFPWGISPCMWGEEEAKTPNCELSSYVGVSMSDGRTQSKQGPTDFHFTSSRLHFGPERIVALLLYLLAPIILRLLVSIVLHLLVLMILHWTIHQCSDLNNTHSYILYHILRCGLHCALHKGSDCLLPPPPTRAYIAHWRDFNQVAYGLPFNIGWLWTNQKCWIDVFSIHTQILSINLFTTLLQQQEQVTLQKLV